MVGTGNILALILGRKEDTYVLCLVIWVLCLQCVHCELAALSVVGKPVAQSTDHGVEYAVDKAVDGNIFTFSHTALTGDPHPWLRVDLENEHCLGSITVALRTNCCDQYRFAGTQVRAGNSPNYAENQPCGLPATRAQSVPSSVNVFQCDPPRMARYITLDIDTSQPIVTNPILQIAEISVEKYMRGECLLKCFTL